MKNYYLLAVAIFSFLGLVNFSAKAQQTCFTISDSENKIYKFRLSDGTILDSKSSTFAEDVQVGAVSGSAFCSTC